MSQGRSHTFAKRLARLGEAAPVSGLKSNKANGKSLRPWRNEPDSNEVTVIGKPAIVTT